MFHKFITSIRHLNHHVTGFDSYMADIQRHGDFSGPTVEEAKKDFRSAMHAKTTGLFR